MYRSSNIALSESTFQKSSYPDKPWWEAGNTSVQNRGMTIEGVAEKGAVTFLLFITSGMTIWGLGLTGQPEVAITLFFVGFILNAVFSIILFLSGSVLLPRPIRKSCVRFGIFDFTRPPYRWNDLRSRALRRLPGHHIQAFLITGMIFGAMLGGISIGTNKRQPQFPNRPLQCRIWNHDGVPPLIHPVAVRCEHSTHPRIRPDRHHLLLARHRAGSRDARL